MTVSSDLNRISYAGNGTTTLFPVNYYFLDNTHLQVILITSAGVETIQILTTNYTVAGAGNPAGGSVSMNVPPPTGTTIVIQRNVPATQETDYLANDPFPAESHERALDKLTMLVQQNQREAGRALKIPLSAVPTSNPELPIPQGGKLLGWNSNASAITYIDPLDFVNVAAQQNSFADVFTGNGVQTSFTLTRNPGSVFNLDVSINGVTQVPNVDYILSATTLTFTSAPPAMASQILARYSESFPLATADAANVRYLPAGGVATNVQAKLRETVSVKDFGAVGDGVTDDTVAIQAALNTGKDVFVPGTDDYYLLTAAVNLADKQRLYGEGERSTLRQTTSLQNVVVGSSRVGCSVENLRIYAIGDISSYANGGGVVFFSSSRCVVRNCLVENHRGAGVNIYSSDDCVVENNIFLNSPVADLESNSNTLADIAVVFDSSRNIVQGNICRSGQAIGILIQSISGSDICDDNIADSNIVEDCKAYGIIAYRVGDLSSGNSTRRAVISNNVIRNISGTILSDVTSTYTFGAGVYLQGAEDSVVIGNTIHDTHSGSVTFAATLAPGAIGATNMTRFVIDGNAIDKEKMYGIFVGDPNNFGETVGQGAISNNKISNTTLSGVQVVNRGALTINGNVVDTSGAEGINIANTVSQRNDISITNNQVKNSGGVANISANFVNNLVVNNNQTNTASIHGISVQNSLLVSVKSNNVKNATTRSIQITASCSQNMVCDNLIAGSGTTLEGIRLDAVTLYDNNQITGCVANYFGAFAPYNTLTVNSATPSVIDGKFFKTENTSATTITNFLGRTGGAEDGQTIFVVFTDANTTLKFAGTTNLRGNAGVDRLMGVNDAIRATYRRSNFVWYVDIIAAA